GACVDAAFSDTVTDFSIYHTVRQSGDFGPKVIAYEYDKIVTDLIIFLGYNPFVLWPTFDPSTITWIDTDILQVHYTLDIKTYYNLTSNTYNIDQQGFRFVDYLVFLPNSPLITLD